MRILFLRLLVLRFLVGEQAVIFVEMETFGQQSREFAYLCYGGLCVG